MATEPTWNAVMRALREARGVSQEGWAARLGYGRRTVQRWEQGALVPDAAAEDAIVALSSAQGLLRPDEQGPQAGQAPTAAGLRGLLAAARLHASGAPVPEPAVPFPPSAQLPLSLTSFVGREREATAITALLATTRLLTLTGPGGIGKTRLALAVAERLLPRFAGAVYFVDLAPLTDAALVPSAVAQTLGVQGLPERPLRESVLRFLREAQALLVLDNYEHLLAAAEFAADVLQAAPGVSILATSRAPLRVPGEREYAIPPLPLPVETSASAAAGAANPAMALFVARAQDVRLDFELTAVNVTTVAAICTRLDGLPLAIELAAARVRVLPPEVLLARLTQRLPLLIGGARTAPSRQQTLRDTIAWSHGLLGPAEQRLFRRLGVFAGGCTLESAEAVCDADGRLGVDVLDGVSSLIEQSLLREGDRQAGEPHYRMLETIREFALAELELSGEAETLRRRFAEYLVAHAEAYATANDWARMDAELDDVRAVLGWCVEREELALGTGLCRVLRLHLMRRGGLAEGEGWRQRLLALPAAAPPSVWRARLLTRAPWDLLSPAEQDRMAADLEEAVVLGRRCGDAGCLAEALACLAKLRLDQSNFAAGMPLAEEALALSIEIGAVEMAGMVRNLLFQVALVRGDLATAEALVVANRAVAGAAGSAISLMHEAELAAACGDAAQARAFWEEAVRRFAAEHGESSPLRLPRLVRFAQFMLRQGDTQVAIAVCAESLAVQRRVGPSHLLPAILQLLAQAAERCGLAVVSARLLGAIDVQRMGGAFDAFRLQADYQAAVARVRAVLDEAAFAAAWAESAALSADDAIELGLGVVAQLQQLLAADHLAYPLR